MIYSWCVNIQRQVCSHNSSTCVSLSAFVDAGVVPEPTKGQAFFSPDSSPHSRHGWQERLWTSQGQQLPPLEQVAWRKVLTRLQTVGLSMQGQSTSNSFRDTHGWINKHSHTWPKCAVWPKWATQTPSHSGQSWVYHLRSLILPVIEKGFLAGSVQSWLLPSPTLHIHCPDYPLTLPYGS